MGGREGGREGFFLFRIIIILQYFSQISYGAPDTRFNNNYQRYLHFFRTLPSYAAVNLAILKLMSQFNWERVALLSSEDKAYARVCHAYIIIYICGRHR